MIIFDQAGHLRAVPSNAVAIVDSVDLVLRAPTGPVVVRNGIRNGTELTESGAAALIRHGLLGPVPGPDVLYLDSPDITAAVELVTKAAAALGKPVLDCCCGGGLLAVSMLARGLEVYGVDASEFSMADAVAAVREAGYAELFHPVVADIASFAMPACFGAAISVADSLRDLGSIGRIARHLNLLATSLVPGAVYVAEVDTNPVVGEAVLSVDTFAKESLERTVLGNRVRSRALIDGTELIELAQTAGFTLRETWGEGTVWYVWRRDE